MAKYLNFSTKMSALKMSTAGGGSRRQGVGEYADYTSGVPDFSIHGDREMGEDGS